MTTPSHTSETRSEYEVRKAKVQQLRDMGIVPYAQGYDKQHSIADLIGTNEKNLTDGHVSPFRDINDIIANPRTDRQTAGRLTLYRAHGKLSFGRLMDESGEIQLMYHRDACALVEAGIAIKKEKKFLILFNDEQKVGMYQKNNQRSLPASKSALIDSQIIRISMKDAVDIVYEKVVDKEIGYEDIGYIGQRGETFLRVLQSKIQNPHTYVFEDVLTGKHIFQQQSPILTGSEATKFLEKLVDIGDFLGVRGELFHTHKGELTLFVSEFSFLAKALRPLGDKFHGVEDTDTLYRQRYLDTIMHRDAHQRFQFRFAFLRAIREFYRANDFMEVETPVLGNSASGAAAAPFITHHNEMDEDMFLRISPETALKKMTVGMFEKIFEVAKDFRNEGASPAHHQEFTMIEHYACYRDYRKNMEFTEQMFKEVLTKMQAQFPRFDPTNVLFGMQKDDGEPVRINFLSFPRTRIDYIAQIQQDSGIDVSLYGPEDAEELRALIMSKGFTRKGLEVQTTATMIDYLYKKVTRPKIVGPAFIYNYPKTMQPLARVSDDNPKIVEQRQLLINGREVIKAYSELVDPILQQANFDEQAAAAQAGDDEATKSDDAFVHAMEYGMPPQSGRGMGIDRILALLLGQHNIRDMIYFPLMKKAIDTDQHGALEEKK